MPFLSDLHKYQSKTTYSLARIQNDRRKDRGGEGRKRKAESKKTLQRNTYMNTERIRKKNAQQRT